MSGSSNTPIQICQLYGLLPAERVRREVRQTYDPLPIDTCSSFTSKLRRPVTEVSHAVTYYVQYTDHNQYRKRSKNLGLYSQATHTNHEANSRYIQHDTGATSGWEPYPQTYRCVGHIEFDAPAVAPFYFLMCLP